MTELIKVAHGPIHLRMTYLCWPIFSLGLLAHLRECSWPNFCLSNLKLYIHLPFACSHFCVCLIKWKKEAVILGRILEFKHCFLLLHLFEKLQSSSILILCGLVRGQPGWIWGCRFKLILLVFDWHWWFKLSPILYKIWSISTTLLSKFDHCSVSEVVMLYGFDNEIH